MFRALFRLILLIVVLVGVGGFLLGWWTFADIERRINGEPGPVGTSGPVSTERARETGARVGEAAATAANQAKTALGNGAITAKIKSKMTLDDLVQARTIDVTTSGQVVTVSGTVRSTAERDRAVQLARETAGVTQVIDRLTIAR